MNLPSIKLCLLGYLVAKLHFEQYLYNFNYLKLLLIKVMDTIDIMLG